MLLIVWRDLSHAPAETLLFPPKLYHTCYRNSVEASRIVVDSVFVRIRGWMPRGIIVNVKSGFHSKRMETSTVVL